MQILLIYVFGVRRQDPARKRKVSMNNDQRQDGMTRHVRRFEVEKPCVKVVASGSEQNIVKVLMILKAKFIERSHIRK